MTKVCGLRPGGSWHVFERVLVRKRVRLGALMRHWFCDSGAFGEGGVAAGDEVLSPFDTLCDPQRKIGFPFKLLWCLGSAQLVLDLEDAVGDLGRC